MLVTIPETAVDIFPVSTDYSRRIVPPSAYREPFLQVF